MVELALSLSPTTHSRLVKGIRAPVHILSSVRGAGTLSGSIGQFGTTSLIILFECSMFRRDFR
jgi:hypothetical protein